MVDNTDRRKALADGFWVDDWFVEPMLNRMSQGEDTVQMEPKVMEVLLCMAEQPGKAVTKEAFMNRVWTDTVVTDDVLSRCISELRKAFDDSPRDPDYIETIRKTGYRLIAPVEIPENGDDASSATTDGAKALSDTGFLRGVVTRASGELDTVVSSSKESWLLVIGGVIERRWLVLSGALVALLFIAAAFYLLRDDSASSTQTLPLNAVPFTSFSGSEVDPALSPDGRQVAFAWTGEDGAFYNIYIMQQGAEAPLRITNAAANEWSPTWSPDGRFVAFVRRTNASHSVYIASSLGGNERRVAQFPHRAIHSVAWSPDTARQALVLALQQRPHQAYGLYQLSLEADTLIQLTRPPIYTQGDLNPAFSPDGSTIAFTRALVNNVQNVMTVSADGQNLRRVLTDSSKISGLDWTGDGKQLIFASNRGGSSGLWRISASGGAPEWIMAASENTSVLHPTLNQNGQQLAFTQHSSRMDIWKLSHPMDYASLRTQRLITSTLWDSNPTIAPDGERIAFASRRSGHPELWTATADGDNLTQLTSFGGPSVHSPRWSPDGKQLAFVSRRHGHSDVYVIDAEGGSLRRLTTHGAEDLTPFWSHDGRAIYFTSSRNAYWDVWRVPASGGPATRITRGGGMAAQEHPDGSSLYVVRPDTSGIWQIPLGEQTSLPVAMTPLPPDTLSPLAPDSAFYATLAANDTAAASHMPAAPPPVRQVVAPLTPDDRANWLVRPRGIYFLRRDLQTTTLMFYRFSTGQTTPVFPLEQVPQEASLTVSPDGEWFLYTREEQLINDVLLVESFK